VFLFLFSVPCVRFYDNNNTLLPYSFSQRYNVGAYNVDIYNNWTEHTEPALALEQTTLWQQHYVIVIPLSTVEYTSVSRVYSTV